MTDEPGGGEDKTATFRADGSRGSSLTERLGAGLNKLTWRTPLHRLRLRGRYPVQLLDVPADPIPGSPRAGRALLEGRMLHAGESVAIDALDRGGFSPAFADYLHSFAWLRDLAAAVARRDGRPVAEDLTRRWLAAHARIVSEPAWRPDLWGRRILFWAAYAPFILDTQDAEYRKEVLHALARGARHLDRTADSAALGLPRVTAWAGVIAAGLLIPGGDARAGEGEGGIAKALGLAMHEDGGLCSRVPVDQLALVELLAQLRAVYEVRARPPAGAVARALNAAVPALMNVTLGDGGLSSWQGGRPASGARVAAAVAGAAVRATPRDDARDWGYQRVAAGAAVLVMDAGPPPVASLAKGGCASTLAFELSDGLQRLVVNCGGGRGLAKDLAEGLRTTAAHSTLVLADTNSTSLHPDGTLGRGVAEVALTRGMSEAGARIEASHDGYVRRFGLLHRRRLMLATDGRLLEGEDRLEVFGRKRARPSAPLGLIIWFHLAPGIETVLTADGQGALLRPSEGAPPWQFRTRGGSLGVEDSLWIDAAGRPHASRALVVTAQTTPEGAVIPWSLRRVR
jgi:uncharacterized heparinase superfamily protein